MSISMMIGVLTAIALFMRALPFTCGDYLAEKAWVHRMAPRLPAAILFLLMVHCVESASFVDHQLDLLRLTQQVTAVVGTILLHLWKRNLSLSIFCGTGLYMLLLQWGGV